MMFQHLHCLQEMMAIATWWWNWGSYVHILVILLHIYEKHFEMVKRNAAIADEVEQAKMTQICERTRCHPWFQLYPLYRSLFVFEKYLRNAKSLKMKLMNLLEEAGGFKYR